MKIGDQIRAYRKQKGLTQAELAEIVGLATITIRQYEKGSRTPKIEQVEKFAKALGITPYDLMGFGYWDATIDNEQLVKEVSALEFVGSTYGEDAVQLLSDFLSLNDTGKRKASEYISDLTEQPKYQSKEYAENLAVMEEETERQRKQAYLEDLNKHQK